MQSTDTCWIPEKPDVGVKTKSAVSPSVALGAGVVSAPGKRVSTVVGMLTSLTSAPATAWIWIV